AAAGDAGPLRDALPVSLAQAGVGGGGGRSGPGGDQALSWRFHSATRSALAASTASASPSIFTELILSPWAMASTTSMPSVTLPKDRKSTRLNSSHVNNS